MPFNGTTFRAVRAWAEQEYVELEKCDYCAEILPEEFWRGEFEDGKFCSEYCAEQATLEDRFETKFSETNQ